MPEVSRIEVSLPEVSRPEVSRSEVSWPKVSRPEVSQLEVSWPEVSRLEVSRLVVSRLGLVDSCEASNYHNFFVRTLIRVFFVLYGNPIESRL